MGCGGSFFSLENLLKECEKKKLPTQRRVRKEPEDNDVML